jgi:hypothetical protein
MFRIFEKRYVDFLKKTEGRLAGLRNDTGPTDEGKAAVAPSTPAPKPH